MGLSDRWSGDNSNDATAEAAAQAAPPAKPDEFSLEALRDYFKQSTDSFVNSFTGREIPFEIAHAQKAEAIAKAPFTLEQCRAYGKEFVAANPELFKISRESLEQLSVGISNMTFEEALRRKSHYWDHIGSSRRDHDEHERLDRFEDLSDAMERLVGERVTDYDHFDSSRERLNDSFFDRLAQKGLDWADALTKDDGLKYLFDEEGDLTRAFADLCSALAMGGYQLEHTRFEDEFRQHVSSHNIRIDDLKRPEREAQRSQEAVELRSSIGIGD